MEKWTLASWTEPVRDLRGRALLVVLGCLVVQLGLGYGYVFGPLAPDILAEFDWQRATLSKGRAPQLFAIALASPLIGFLSVRLGARVVIGASAALLGLAYLGFSEFRTFWQLFGLTVVFGLAVAGLGDIAVGQVVTQWVERGRGLALGLVYTGSNLGGALFIALATGIAERASWREAFAAMGWIAVAVLLPVALFVVRDRAPADRAGAVSSARLPAGPALGVRDALRTRSFWILLFSLFTFFFYFLGVLESLVLHLMDEGLPRAEAAGHLGRATALGIASKIAFGAMADRLGARRIVLLDYGLLALSSVLLLLVPADPFLAAFVLAYGFSAAARDVVYPLIVIECFGARYMAEIYGVLMLALLPGGVLGPIFAASVFDATGSYRSAYLVFAALNLVATGCLLALRSEGRAV